MNESSALLALQERDIEITRAKKRLDELPEKRAILEMRAKQRQVAEMHQKAEMLVRKLEAEIKARQDEITMLNDKIAGEQARLDETSDHRQVQVITRDMDGLRRRIDKLEMESLKYMERSEKASGQVATIDQALAQLSANENSLVERFKTVGGELQTEIAGMEAGRTQLAADVSPALLERYEAARASKGGIGVGQLDGDTCTACRMSLPAERVRDLAAGPDVGICPQCRRLIVVRTGGGE
jgi:hypothetical protein